MTGQASWNVDDFGPEVAKDQRVDTTVEDFDTWLAETARPPSFGKNTLGALVEDLGVTVAEQSSTTRPRSRPSRSLRGAGLTVEPGRVIGFTDVDTVRTEQGITLTFEMTGRLYLEGEADINDWTFTGEPELHLSNPAVPTGMTTVTQLVNRIPDVINAPPGFITMEKLPRPRYRTYPLGAYLDHEPVSDGRRGAGIPVSRGHSSGTSPAGASRASARSSLATGRPSSSARSLRATAARTTVPPM